MKPIDKAAFTYLLGKKKLFFHDATSCSPIHRKRLFWSSFHIGGGHRYGPLSRHPILSPRDWLKDKGYTLLNNNPLNDPAKIEEHGLDEGKPSPSPLHARE